MKKILVFIDWFLPGSKAGGPVRSLANLLDYLDAECSFYLLTRNTDYCSVEPYPDVEADRWIPYGDNSMINYCSAGSLSVSGLRAIVVDLRPDLIYATGIYSFYFSLLPVYFGRMYRIPTVVAPRGMMSQQSFSSKSLKKKVFYALFRLFRFYKDVRFHATSTAEIDDIQQQAHSTDIVYAPNLPRKLVLDKLPRRMKKAGELSLVAMARISPEKNIHFAIECLMGCKGKVCFDVYGAVYDEEYFRQCQRLASSLPDSIELNFRPSIPTEQVMEVIQRYHFVFLPTTGENFGHSILEGFAAQTPALISNRTPWRDLAVKGLGFDLPLDRKDLFIEALQTAVSLTEDQYSRYPQACRLFIQEYYSAIDLQPYRRLFQF